MATVCVALILATVLVASCGRSEAPAAIKVERSRVSMGSQLTLSAWTTSEPDTEAAFEHVFREFDRLESLLSVWKDGSDVVRLNTAAGVSPVAVSRDTIEVLRTARDASELTGGKFDITFGALSDIWRFDHDQDNVVPDRRLIEARLPRIDYAAVQVNEAAGTAFITRPNMRVHLGGIGKGYAIDRAVALLKQQHLADFMIQSGGDLYVAGTNGGKPWKLAIADPRGAHEPFATVEIRDGTFSTSGDYERSFMKDGVRYHHLLDPDLGEPARGCRSVTIVTNRAVMADVLSTGVFIMGPQRGMELIEKLPDVEGVIVTAQNDVLVSSGLQRRLALLRPPTDAR
ncbi:MAG TPA: FAD:protein FMN transferase [Vicinamibacterales bacterium]|nr:FAD:protein FMN transferase [Vicinamibacterales bacterium]